jgi:hypothetical protein
MILVGISRYYLKFTDFKDRKEQSTYGYQGEKTEADKGTI